MGRKTLEVKEKILVVLSSLGICAGISYLFYHSIWGMVIFPGIYILVGRVWRKERTRKAEQLLQESFIHGLQVLNGSLQAGLSMENAWKEVEKEELLLHSAQSQFYQEIRQMNRSVSYNVPIESLFSQVANRYENEEMIRFAQIMEFGKRSGGNWKRMIEDTVLRMSERYETQKEIEVMVAGKKLEQKVMNIVPLGMLFFLKLSSWEYVRVLYETTLGVLIMTMCLILYGGALVLSERIMDIQV